MPNATYRPLVYRAQGGDELHIKDAGLLIAEDNALVKFGDDGDVIFKWDATNLTIKPLTDDTGAIVIGDGTTDMDVKVFLGTTGAFVLFDVGNISLVVSAGVTLSVDCVTDTTNAVTGSIHTDGGLGIAKALWVGTTSRLVGNVQMDGTLIVGNDAAGRDFTLFGDVTAYKAWWDANGDTNGMMIFGADTKGVDVKAFGVTTGSYLLWDASADALVFIGVAKLDIGSSGTPLVLTAGTPIVEIYATCASTSGSTSAQALVVNSVMTGAGGVGGRSLFSMDTNVALAGWSNALKALVTYGTSGKTTGIGSVFCAEMVLSAGTTSGTYAPLESELVADSAISSGTATSFLYCNIAGSNSTGKTTLNTNGYLLELGAGVVDTTDGLFDAATITPTTVEFDAALRIRIGGVNYFIPVSLDKAFE